MNCLIIYYSRTGQTRMVAEALARQTQADLDAVADARSRPGRLGLLHAAWQAMQAVQPDIRAPIRHAPRYDLVILGTPVWAGHLAAPMRTYIARNRQAFRRVAAFCTTAGRTARAEQALGEISRLCNQPLAGGLVLSAQELGQPGLGARIAQFARTLVPG